MMNAVQLSLITFVSTSVGGPCALRFRDRLHLILGFTAGVLLGVVCFDSLPEVFERSRSHGSDGRSAMVALALGSCPTPRMTIVVGLVAADIKAILKRTSIDVVTGHANPASDRQNKGLSAGPGPDGATGSGLVNAHAAWLQA